MIRLENFVKVFRTEEIETTAIDNISFEIKEKEFLAIMGPSGCGKSTLLNLLGLLDSSTSGQYYLYDKEVSNASEKEKTILRKGNIGFVFQSFNLIDELTVYQNVELPLIYSRMNIKERKTKVLEILKKVEIDHRKNHYPQQLSGGQQQRVAVARAVINNPKVILADEPTGNLDSQNGEIVMDILTNLYKEGTTIVMVTHSEDYAKYANRVIRLLDGKIVKQS